MQKQFEIMRKLRAWLIDFTNDLTIEELNEVPAGFNNNIAWNLAHLVATQQNLIYRNSNVPALVEDAFIEQFKPGTKPAAFMDAAAMDNVRRMLSTHIDQTEADYNKGLFHTYNTFQNRYGIAVEKVEDVITMIDMHEGLHTGYIMALKRTIRNK
ncbi:DinB family protein [Chitinophaga horti]|uniref:DinB family protein n=1 Tax=Chitinophaga horti TaxID=2920382 RepID=A0ABY6JAL5_9BACT|nr:DinB family protein [Chitinophaga horti]UYQ95339.1 DinB family protein [Chitinophaga horti]